MVKYRPPFLLRDRGAPMPEIKGDDITEYAIMCLFKKVHGRVRRMTQVFISSFLKMKRIKHPRFALNHTRVKVKRRKK